MPANQMLTDWGCYFNVNMFGSFAQDRREYLRLSFLSKHRCLSMVHSGRWISLIDSLFSIRKKRTTAKSINVQAFHSADWRDSLGLNSTCHRQCEHNHHGDAEQRASSTETDTREDRSADAAAVSIGDVWERAVVVHNPRSMSHRPSLELIYLVRSEILSSRSESDIRSSANRSSRSSLRHACSSSARPWWCRRTANRRTSPRCENECDAFQRSSDWSHRYSSDRAKHRNRPRPDRRLSVSLRRPHCRIVRERVFEAVHGSPACCVWCSGWTHSNDCSEIDRDSLVSSGDEWCRRRRWHRRWATVLLCRGIRWEASSISSDRFRCTLLTSDWCAVQWWSGRTILSLVDCVRSICLILLERFPLLHRPWRSIRVPKYWQPREATERPLLARCPVEAVRNHQPVDWAPWTSDFDVHRCVSRRTIVDILDRWKHRHSCDMWHTFASPTTTYCPREKNPTHSCF